MYSPTKVPSNFRRPPMPFMASTRMASDHLKCSASELLTVIPLLVQFSKAAVLPTGMLQHEHASLVSLDYVLALLLSGADPDTIKVATIVHHENFLRACPADTGFKFLNDQEARSAPARALPAPAVQASIISWKRRNG